MGLTCSTAVAALTGSPTKRHPGEGVCWSGFQSASIRAAWNPMPAMHSSTNARNGARFEEVGDPGLEPGTSSLSEKRSNRLS